MNIISYKSIKKAISLMCAISILLSTVACSTPPSEVESTTPPVNTVDSREIEQKRISAEIDAIYNSWLSEEIDAPSAITNLEIFLTSDITGIVTLANEKIDYITLESASKELLSQAQTFFDNEDYISAIKTILQIDPAYSQYNAADEFLSMCHDAIVIEVSTPSTIEEYENCIILLDAYLALIDDTQIATRKIELESELVILKDIADITGRAAKLYDNKKYKEAFFTLAQGLNKYPNNETLESNLIDFHDHYIIYITQLVNIQCEQKEYKEALKTLDEASAEYNCQEFELLREYVKELRNPLYKFTKDTVTKFKTVAQGWESEELDVKQLANDTGTYVMKSGKQLLLGDYSGENVTILSFGGNVVASIAGIDAVLDLRDLSYDLVHWGEDEYFAFYLAADVLALLPVIGVAKYFDHFKDAGKLAESVGDVIKKSEAVTEATDELTTVVKHSDDIAEVAQNIRHLAKYDDAFKQTIYNNIADGYYFENTINAKLLGLIQAESGVEFVLQKLDYSDGRKIMGVFPKFDSKADVELPPNLYKASENDHKKYCLTKLQDETKNVLGKYWKNFSKEEREIIQSGKLPSGYTWHHNEKEGLMQLVDSKAHNLAKHTGGMKLWGIGYKTAKSNTLTPNINQ